MKYNLLAKCIALSFVLSGCSISRINDTMDKAESNNQIATKAMTDFTVNRPSVVYKDEQWINPQPLKFNPEDVPPPELTCKVAYKPVRPVDIYQFAQDVTTLYHSRCCHVAFWSRWWQWQHSAIVCCSSPGS